LDTVASGTVHFMEKFINLYTDDGTAAWYQHGTLKNVVDVAIVNLGQHLQDTGIFHINEIATANDMVITIGADLFILGYPRGFSHFIDTPIWKRGSIASEPHLEAPNTHNRIIVVTLWKLRDHFS
jgi:hypothetical protein